jgi:hypothetical protein
MVSREHTAEPANQQKENFKNPTAVLVFLA